MVEGKLIWAELPPGVFDKDDIDIVVTLGIDPSKVKLLSKPNFYSVQPQMQEYLLGLSEVLDRHVDIENLPTEKDKKIMDEFKHKYVGVQQKLNKVQRRELKFELRRNPKMTDIQIAEFINNILKDEKNDF